MLRMGILELLRQLEAEHQPGRHLYRGQVRRYPPHRWTADDGPHEVEALYPSDFRFHYAEASFSPGTTEAMAKRVTAARAYQRDVRDQFVAFLLAHLATLPASFEWAQTQLADFRKTLQGEGGRRQDSHFYRMAWSLAQHYLVATALTDVSFDPRVAAWFATHPWDAQQPGPAAGDIGVIYRFDREKLERVLSLGTQFAARFADDEGLERAPELFVVDVREIPASIARRPAAQQGASIYGFDQPHVVAGAMRSGAIEVFEFEQRPGVDIGIGRGDITPAEDPFLGPLEKFSAIRQRLRPNVTHANTDAATGSDRVERANTVLRLGLTSAHHCATHPLTDEVVAATFDEVERLGRIRFSYLMLVEHRPTGAFVCAITAEPMELPEALKALPPEVLARFGFGSDVLRCWAVGGAAPVAYGHWSTLAEFTDKALEVARSALAGRPPPAAP
ncbi:MAG: FRG domain-containing protein [Burkholderiaceae bacterium]|nr:FRG domain-containing protein [Burkholderiaceae bacterium]